MWAGFPRAANNIRGGHAAVVGLEDVRAGRGFVTNRREQQRRSRGQVPPSIGGIP